MRQLPVSFALLPALFLGFLSFGGCYTQLDITEQESGGPVVYEQVILRTPPPPPPPILIIETVVQCDNPPESPKRDFGKQRSDGKREGTRSGARPARGR